MAADLKPVALLLLLAGCASPHSPSSIFHPPSSAAPLSVPFIAQKPNYCGPAALAMLANFYGHAVTQDEIASAIYLPDIRGSLSSELSQYAQRFNLWTRQYRGTSADLRQKLAAGIPILVLGKFGNNFHYFLVLGFDGFRRTVIVHSDTRPDLAMSEEEFLIHWNKADRWTMLACPPDRATWKLSADEHNDLGVFLERDHQLIEAAAHYEETVALTPSNSYFQMNLGNALRKLGNLPGAAAAFAKAVSLDPNNADALNNLADVYLEQGSHLDEATELCRSAASIRPSHRAYYLDTLGSILVKQGKPQEAITAFTSALAATTDRQSALRAGIEQRLAAARALAEK